LGPGPGNLSQNGQKPILPMTSLTKNLNPKSKNFFIANEKNRFGQLFNTINCELWSCEVAQN